MPDVNRRAALIVAGLTGFLGIALGAFGAHALKHILNVNHMILVWNTAVLYHLVHAPVLMMLAQTKTGNSTVNAPPFLCFCVGILFFSGSLYVLALTNIPWLGAITPVGGLLLMAGWLLIALGAFKGVFTEEL